MKTLAAAIALLLLVAPLSAATHEQLFASGKQAMAGKELEKAVDLFEQAIKLNPRSSEYHYWLGGAYGELAQKSNVFKQASLAKKAQNALETAVQLDPNNLDPRFALIDFYKFAPGFMGGSDEKALQQAVEIKKRDVLLGHRAYARIYLLDKKPELATKEYTDAIRENPSSAKAHHYYAMHLTNQKNYKQAFEEFEVAAKFDPPFMPAYYRIGSVALLSGTNYARGEETLKKYLTYTPKDNEPSIVNAWYLLGQIYEKQGRKADAKQSYANALKLAPNAKYISEAMKRVS